VKLALNTNVSYRRRYARMVLFFCVGAGALCVCTRTPVSAHQSTAAQPQADHPEFPAGEGRDTVMRLCVKCHSPNVILASGQNRLGWENTVTKMVRLGAVGTDEDFSDIVDYLTDKFPPSPVQKIFVNMATDKQIASVLEIDVDQAKAIIAYREKVKGFKSIDDLKKVPDVDTKKIDAKASNLVF
jgi:competence protein ComEA